MTTCSGPSILGNSVSRKRLQEHICEFAKRVKLSGSPEELESFGYLRQQLESFGYRTQLLMHDAFISLPGPARVETGGQSIECITHSMAASTPEEGVSGTLVYLGSGTREEFAGCDVRGQIILVNGIATEEVADRASKSGAAGAVHISPNQYLYEMCVSPVWGSPSEKTRRDLPTAAICTIGSQDGKVLRDRCVSGETVNVTLTAKVDTGWRRTPLLVADLEPAGAEAPFILLSGHHDTWHYGVMDNGGANATMLEAARLLSEIKDVLKRNLRICFWSGHSHGRYSGSAWYAEEYFRDLDQNCAAHVNIDSTGGKGATVLENSGVIDELQVLAHEVIKFETGQSHAGQRHARAADQSFWGVGIPSMFGSLSHQPCPTANEQTALGWWWHTPHDTADHIDPDILARDTVVVVEVLRRLLCEPVLPLDYERYCASLRKFLEPLKTGLQEKIDLTTAFALLEKLRTAIAISRRWAEISDEISQAEFNRSLMRASRHLVPLNYTLGDRFVHDDALPHSPWPALTPLKTLAELPAEPGTAAFYAVSARRARNRLEHALIEACRELGA